MGLDPLKIEAGDNAARRVKAREELNIDAIKAYIAPLEDNPKTHKPNLEPYLDIPSGGKKKPKWTIGTGHLIGKEGSDADLAASNLRHGITASEAKVLFDNDLINKLDVVTQPNQLGESFYSYSPELKNAVVASYFRGDLGDSPKTRALMRAGDFEGAAKELLNNEDFRNAHDPKHRLGGVIDRFNEFANLLRTEKDRQRPIKTIDDGGSFAEIVDGKIQRLAQ